MNQQMTDAFIAGAGVSPDNLRLTVQLICTGVIFLVFGWVMLQIHLGYKDGRVEMADATWSAIKATVIMAVLLTVVVR